MPGVLGHASQIYLHQSSLRFDKLHKGSIKNLRLSFDLKCSLSLIHSTFLTSSQIIRPTSPSAIALILSLSCQDCVDPHSGRFSGPSHWGNTTRPIIYQTVPIWTTYSFAAFNHFAQLTMHIFQLLQLVKVDSTSAMRRRIQAQLGCVHSPVHAIDLIVLRWVHIVFFLLSHLIFVIFALSVRKSVRSYVHGLLVINGCRLRVLAILYLLSNGRIRVSIWNLLFFQVKTSLTHDLFGGAVTCGRFLFWWGFRARFEHDWRFCLHFLLLSILRIPTLVTLFDESFLTHDHLS